MRQQENFEYAEKTTIQFRPILHTGYWAQQMIDAYWELRAKAAKEFPPIAFYPDIGFTVFVENAELWLEGLTVTLLRGSILTTSDSNRITDNG